MSRILFQKYIDMANQFKSVKVPLGGIGAQGHFNYRPKPELVIDRLDRLAKIGLPIWITELDYTTKSDRDRANVLEDLLTAFFR